MEDEENDPLFEKAFEKAIQQMPPAFHSTHHNSWQITQKKLKALNRRKRRNRALSYVALITASIMIGSFLFGTSAKTKAFSPIYQSIVELPGQMISFFFGNQDKSDKGAKTIPPEERDTSHDKSNNESSIHPLSGQESHTISVMEDEVNNKLTFTPPSFPQLPEGYQLSRIDISVQPNDAKSNEVLYVFKNEEAKLLRVNLQQLESGSVVGSLASAASSTVEIIPLLRGKGYLTSMPNETKKLEFMLANLYIHIVGNLSKADLIAFAESMNQK
ncbi:DUF4367 domain-containing protein [Paenibacillus sp. Leaf72]|uniref:DUF4367 domain-containing protein n=1 Tax=Paenibacillus sp. Leaf72 TaxID=1736234 RepID=UPI0006FE7FF3|nr:DUF4367 domain-containing protein [Paenibacillus sp. Leaf72]KQN99866.1 hypothetical protein ASF12_16880 [Paenibacillus sp. Leaf72]